jgi:peptidoglycan/xylan/chitin deacetylase (PgdA/CDA1 family)
MRLVSPLLKHIVYPGLSRSGYLRRLATSAPAVVTYHGIVPGGYEVRDAVLDGHLVTAEAFTRQMQLLKSSYNIISPQEFLRWCEGDCELPRRSVLLTCDDGLVNTLTDMLPIIQKMGVPFLFFVTSASCDEVSSMLWYEQLYILLQAAGRETLLQLRQSLNPDRAPVQVQSIWMDLMKKLSALDWHSRRKALDQLRTRIGISNRWDSEYSQNEALRRRFFMLNVTELKELQRSGATIGAHSISHPMLSQMAECDAFEEISGSRSRLEAALGGPVLAFALPFGNSQAVSDREPELAKRAGFRFAFMNVEDTSAENKFAFPRVHVSFNTTVAELDAHLSGLHQSIRGRFAAAGSV